MDHRDDEARINQLFTILGIAAAIIFIIFLIVSYFIGAKRSARLEIYIAPSFAEVVINDQTYKTDGTFSFEPGNYTAKISADGFTSREVNLELKKGETTELLLYLIPSDGNMDWYASHPEEDMRLTNIGSRTAAKESLSYLEAHPISKILPINIVEVDKNTYAWTEFRIDGGVFKDIEGCGKPEDYCVKITDSTGGNKERALREIRSRGYNPDDYKIIYVYTPFE